MEDKREQTLISLSADFAVALSNESDRGGILLGCSIVERYLTELIETILPEDNKKYKNKILNYPGPLSTFSGKIELAYAFRIIDKNIYSALNSLRKIRNEAAHSNNDFTFSIIETRLEELYTLKEGNPELIHNIAKKHLYKWKEHIIESGAKEKGLDVDEIKKMWLEELDKEDTKQILDVQLIGWKLYYGLAILCMHIDMLKQHYKIKFSAAVMRG